MSACCAARLLPLSLSLASNGRTPSEVDQSTFTSHADFFWGGPLLKSVDPSASANQADVCSPLLFHSDGRMDGRGRGRTGIAENQPRVNQCHAMPCLPGIASATDRPTDRDRRTDGRERNIARRKQKEEGRRKKTAKRGRKGKKEGEGHPFFLARPRPTPVSRQGLPVEGKWLSSLSLVLLSLRKCTTCYFVRVKFGLMPNPQFILHKGHRNASPIYYLLIPFVSRNPRLDPLRVIVRDRAFLFLSSKGRAQSGSLGGSGARARAGGRGRGGAAVAGAGGRAGGRRPFGFGPPFFSPPEFGRGSKQSCGHFFRPLKNKSSDSLEKQPETSTLTCRVWTAIGELRQRRSFACP